MMKVLKYVLLLLLVVAVGLGIYAAIQPGEYDFTRSRTIQAPAEVVYEQVDDYKKWEEWGPWNEQDPTIRATYNEKTKGPGASYSWTSKEGDGKATRVESVPYTSLADELDFGSMGRSTAYWKFQPRDGATEVTWGMRAQHVPYMMKFFSALSGGYEGMMAPMFDRGLERLDSISTLKANENTALMGSWTISEVALQATEVQKFIGYPHSSTTDLGALQKIYMESLPKAGEYAMENGLEYGDFIPGAIFNSWDEEKGETDFMVGIFLKKDLRAGEGMQTVTVAAGNKVAISKFGNYGTGDDEAHNAISDYIEDNNLTTNGPVYEMYVNDPTEVKPNEIQTDIYYPVK